MGYCITVKECNVFIPNDQKVVALKTLKSTAANTDRMGGGGYTGGEVVERWFAWIDMKKLANANTLVEAFDAWRYIFTEDEDGVRLEYFHGEKLGDDVFLWETMAPFIQDGGYITVIGEDDTFWRWKFNNGICEEVELRLMEV